MDLVKLRMLAGISVTPEHFKQQRELREAKEKAKRDYDKDGKVETSEEEYKGSRDRAIKKNVKEQMGHEMKFNVEPDSSTSDHIDPNDPELQQVLAQLRDMSDEERLAFIRDLIAQSHETLGTEPGPESVVHDEEPTDVPAGEEEPIVREDHFKKGQMVKDKEGNDWKVTGYTGGGEKSDEEVYSLRCPKTGKTAKKKVTELHEGTADYGNDHPHPLSHQDEQDAVNAAVKGDTEFPVTGKDESPDVYAHVDQGPNARNEVTEKVTVPQNVKTSLQETINELRRVAEKIEKRDPAQSWFNNMAADAMQEILNNLNLGTVMGIKEAQIQTTKLMGPILQRIPDEVFHFIARGGQNRSLKDYFYEVKGYPIEGPRNTLR